MSGKINRSSFPYLHEPSWLFSVRWELNF